VAAERLRPTERIRIRIETSAQTGQAIQHEAARDGDVQAGSLADHRDLHARVGGLHLLLGDAVPLVTEQDDRSLPRRLQPRERYCPIGQLDALDLERQLAQNLRTAIAA
jgi:hypothetical protein